MAPSPLPLHRFSPHREADLPFEIARVEQLPAVARTARPHRHAFYEIVWITGGAGQHHIDFDAYPILPNTFYFLSPGQVHGWLIDAPLSGFALLFTEEFLSVTSLERLTPHSFDFFHHLDQPPLLSLAPDHARPIHELCQHLLDEYQGQAYGRLTILQAIFHILLIHAQRHYTHQAAPRVASAAEQLVESYLRLIEQHFREQQQVHEYAALLGVTPGHLTDATRERMGQPASHFIHRRIVLEAKRLLAYSEQSVAEIGFALKFDDPSYFTRFFRRECGTPPTTFRRLIREKYQTPRNPAL